MFGDSKLSPGALVLRFSLIGAVLAGAVGLFAHLGGWFTPHALTPDSMIDTFQKVNGEHPGFRRNHAKGVCFRGYFESNGRGTELSKAELLHSGRTPVIGRFALAGGQPFVTDAAGIVRSMAVLFQLPDGEEWRTGMNNIPVFPVRNAQGFHDQLLALAPDTITGKPDPAKKAFLASCPETAKGDAPHPESPDLVRVRQQHLQWLERLLFHQCRQQGDARALVDGAGAALRADQCERSRQADKNYLFDALIAAIPLGPQKWHLVVAVGQPGDPTDDATIPWPEDRRKIDVGTLVIDQVESEDVSPARDINFDPLILPDGIAGSDDPLLSARSAAYSVSFTRREGERKEPSAISATETEK